MIGEQLIGELLYKRGGVTLISVFTYMLGAVSGFEYHLVSDFLFNNDSFFDLITNFAERIPNYFILNFSYLMELGGLSILGDIV